VSPFTGLPRPIHPLARIEVTTVAPTASTQTRGRREAPANSSSRREKKLTLIPTLSARHPPENATCLSIGPAGSSS
jgi:hypothetical protein